MPFPCFKLVTGCNGALHTAHVAAEVELFNPFVQYGMSMNVKPSNPGVFGMRSLERKVRNLRDPRCRVSRQHAKQTQGQTHACSRDVGASDAWQGGEAGEVDRGIHISQVESKVCGLRHDL